MNALHNAPRTRLASASPEPAPDRASAALATRPPVRAPHREVWTA